MRRGLQNIIKTITAPAGLVASRRGSAGARVSVRQHKLVRAHGNREVSEVAGVSDQGQISRLMMRLREQGLVENMGGAGHAKAWRITPRGEEILHVKRPLPERTT